MWNFAWSCSNLSTLDLALYDLFEDDLEEEDENQFEGEGPVVQAASVGATELRTLNLEVEKLQGDCNPVARSLGSLLEVLQIKVDYADAAARALVSSGALDSILSDSRQNLKFLDFHRLRSEFHGQVINWSISFPSLESLTLFNVRPPLLKYFSKLESPRLQKLNLGCNGEDAQETFQCLLSLLVIYQSNLIELDFKIYNHPLLKLPVSGLYNFSFPRLR